MIRRSTYNGLPQLTITDALDLDRVCKWLEQSGIVFRIRMSMRNWYIRFANEEDLTLCLIACR